MKRLFLLIVIMTAFWPMKTIKGSVTNVYTEPNQPTNRDSIAIVVSGVEGQGPVLITDSNFQMEGNSLELDIFLNVDFLDVVTPWSHTELIGTLPADTYSLTVNAYYSGSSTGTDTYLTSFTVFPGPPIEAELDINPNTLNLRSKGKWLTCYIWLPEDYNVADIEPNSVVLEAEPNDIEAQWIWFEEDEEEELAMAKFNRSELTEILVPGEVELTLTGELTDGTIFEGTDIIRVIDKRRRKNNSAGKAVRR